MNATMARTDERGDTTRQLASTDHIYKLVEEHQRAGRLVEAAALVYQVLDTKPGDARALHYLGLIAYQRGQVAEAFELVQRSIALAPHIALHYSNLGEMYRRTGRPELAVHCGEQAIALEPDNAQLLNCLGVAYFEHGDLESAISVYRRTVALDPTHSMTFNNLGNALTELGRLEEAAAAYSRSLSLEPNRLAVHFSYANIVKYDADDPHLRILEAMHARRGSLNDPDRTHLDFALAKAYADLNEHQRCFRHLLNGNALKRAQIRYDEAAECALIDRIKTIFPSALLRQGQYARNSVGPTPIFIIGMPRSGSTLIEQILAAHGKVHAGGELRAFYDVANSSPGPNGRSVPYPEFVAGLGSRDLMQIEARYLGVLRSSAPAASHITDKRLSNYFFAGLIHLALPDARIIHVLRDPLDTCVSCFSKLFATGQNHYTYDLAELGRYWRRYRDLMSHWRHVLPPGGMLEVRYEDVVEDLETQARGIVGYCGLEWDPACLAFQTVDRPVRTASAAQVRHPLYRGAVGRARRYEEFLAPLKNALAG